MRTFLLSALLFSSLVSLCEIFRFTDLDGGTPSFAFSPFFFMAYFLNINSFRWLLLEIHYHPVACFS